MTISTDLLQRPPDIDDPAFAFPFDRYADGKVALVGEASPGTSEFYRARAAITLRLVKGHGFDHRGIARRLAEGDLPPIRAPCAGRTSKRQATCATMSRRTSALRAALQKRSCASSYGKQPSDLRNRISGISTR